MMTKTVVGLCLVAALCLGFSSAATFDGVDVAALLKNDTAVQSYVKCILGTGECSESAKRLQAIVPNALQQKCSQCTEQQKIIIGTIVAKMQKSFPADWEKLLQKYDPEKKHRENILALAKAVPTGLPATTPKPK
ncbi:ejaculatory bulb-specific protein 3-like isoform X3 [Thrips palmi]|uniref:Ejaculatory bulb-specific protein 3-like isoform X3 n=1 Tax=Thrips palmi TaxID=161013 RepID=A0A6P8Z6H1_THRPL|nr:ejaculatory bulb-specific protein 3-like isoform X3 [Thrips palmi]